MNIDELVSKVQELSEQLIVVCNDIKWIKGIGLFIAAALIGGFIKDLFFS